MLILINTSTWKYFWRFGCLKHQVKLRGKKLGDEERWGSGAPAEEVAVEGWGRVVDGVPEKYYYYYGVPAKAPIQCKIVNFFCTLSAEVLCKKDWKKRATSSRICSRPCPRRTAGSPCPTGQTTWWLKLPWYEPDSSYRHIVPMVVMSVVSLMLYFLTVRSSMLSNDTNIIVIITMNNKDHHHNWLALSDCMIILAMI